MTVKSFLLALALSALAIFAPLKPVLLAIAFMVAADLLTGVLAARKRGDPLTWVQGRRTIIKLGVFAIALATGLVAETYLLLGILPVVKLLSGVIGLNELKSIYGNLSDVSGSDSLGFIISKINGQTQPPRPS